MTLSLEQIWHMRSALNLARQGLGRVWPNPSVGCVIVKDGHIVARARTCDGGGRPHAETEALAMAGDQAKGACVYVTLEPCAHQGKTGPCAQALIEAGVAQVLVAVEDTDERVAGRGIKMLRDAGVEVVVGVLEDKARELNEGFFLRHSEARPLINLKTATTLDAKIATNTGQSKWITGGLSRQRAHLIRAQHDAICVGVNTVLADNPTLTTRVNGVSHEPVRIVFDTNLRLTDAEKIFKQVEGSPVWVMTSVATDDERAQALQKLGVNILTVEKGADGHVDLKSAMAVLCKKGITRLLVEGGAGLVTSFLALGLYDNLYWFKAGSIIGADGLSAMQPLGIKKLDHKISIKHSNHLVLDDDVLDVYKRIG